MKIYIQGEPKSISKVVLRRAANVFADALMDYNFHSKMVLMISFGEGLGYTKAQICPWFNSSNRSPKIFSIELRSNLSFDSTIKYLSHEFVHLRQYATNELYYYQGKKIARWKGEIFPIHHDNFKTATVDYLLSPWEIEARGYEEALFLMFFVYVGKLPEWDFKKNFSEYINRRRRIK